MSPAAAPLRLALTVGDPAGIGPEIVLKALAARERPRARWIVYGPASALDERARELKLDPLSRLDAELVDTGGGPFDPGRVAAAAGRAAAEGVLRAAHDALGGRLAGIVTGPLHKESLRAAGYPWPGHTELLAEAAGTADVAMMFVGGGLRVALLTIHRSLRAVPDAITGELVRRVVRLVDRELPRFGTPRRLIAVCGLNPHAGEAGLFGREEVEVIAPAVRSLREEGIDVHGPLSADTLFPRAARGDWDAVIAAYHDQGLVPVKLAAFGRSVNVTLGLPFVRTSVDHGTAFDIVRKGTADAGSLLEAMRLAVTLVSASAATAPEGDPP